MSLAFKPVGIISGLLAGMLGKKVFSLVWRLIDNEAAPQPKHRQIHLGKLAIALVIEGAILGVVRGFAEHGTRHGFAALAGDWPGEESPKASAD